MTLRRFLMIATLFILMMSLSTSAVFAQQEQANTITVTGTGSATTAPDMATLSVGVELSGDNILSVYGDVNNAISNVMQALEGIGIADEDMRTAGLDVYVSPMFMGEGQVRNETRISNRINITVRDLSQIETVIDTAINSGANSIFGLQFGVADSSTLESEARINALTDARSRAEEIAETLGVELGSVVSVIEHSGNSGRFDFAQNAMLDSGGGAVVEPGRISVSMSVEVTYRFDG